MISVIMEGGALTQVIGSMMTGHLGPHAIMRQTGKVMPMLMFENTADLMAAKSMIVVMQTNEEELYPTMEKNHR